MLCVYDKFNKKSRGTIILNVILFFFYKIKKELKTSNHLVYSKIGWYVIVYKDQLNLCLTDDYYIDLRFLERTLHLKYLLKTFVYNT